jgi:hypothetical protein
MPIPGATAWVPPAAQLTPTATSNVNGTALPQAIATYPMQQFQVNPQVNKACHKKSFANDVIRKN